MNRTEARARQNRSIALVLTILVHLAVIAFIVYGKTSAKEEQTSTKVSVEHKNPLSAKP